MDRRSSSTRWRMLLAPWKATAESLGQLYQAPTDRSSDNDKRDGHVWLLWDIASHDDEDMPDLRRQLQLMELLDLLARVDRDVFKEFVVTICGSVEGVQLLHFTQAEEDEAIVNFRFGYHVDVKTSAMLSSSHAIQRLVLGYNENETSPMFTEVRDALLRQLEETSGEQFTRCNHRIPIRLGCGRRPRCGAAWVFALSQIAALQHSMERDDAVHEEGASVMLLSPSAFRIQYAEIRLMDEPEPAALVLTSMAQIVRFGIEISYLQLSMIYFTKVDPATLTKSLHVLFQPSQAFPSRQQPSETFTSTRGVGHLELNISTEYWAFRRLCSAIAHSQSLHTLSLRDDIMILDVFDEVEETAEQRVSRVRWLVFALFSPYATHTIQKLYLPAASILVELSGVVVDVIAHPHPVTYLDIAFDNSTDNTYVDIPREASVWFRRPRHGEGSAASSCGNVYGTRFHGLRRVQVLGYDSDLQNECLTVFLPGWGEAWIKSSDVTGQVDLPIPRGGMVHEIPHIIIRDYTPSAMNNLVQILENIGSSISTLEIEGLGGVMPTEGLDMLLRACPALIDLRAKRVRFESLSPVFESGATRLAHLTLMNVCILEADFQANFLIKLKNACWSHLRGLFMKNVRAISPDATHRSLSHEVLGLLDECPQLCSLEVVVDASECPSESLVRRFEMLNGRSTNVRKSPLILEGKMAFLSALQQPKCAITRNLSSDIVANIFQFAAVTVVRRCGIHLHTTRSRLDGNDDELSDE